MKAQGRIKTFLLLSVSIAVTLSCATAPQRPNISALYRVPSLRSQLPPLSADIQSIIQQPLPKVVHRQFQALYELDPSLALEVGRLPEFQGEVAERQILSLTRFTDLAAKATTREKTNIAELLRVGKPEHRRYCTPLQAIFWLLEADDYNPKTDLNPLQYSLEGLLVHAWDWSEYERWGDFETVTDRLNSPFLIDYYVRANLRYESHGVCAGYPKSLFRTKRGCCSDFTAFSEYSLRKGGYEAKAIKVASPTGKAYHVVCEFEENGRLYIIDNSCWSCTPRNTGILPKEEYTKKLRQIGYGYI